MTADRLLAAREELEPVSVRGRAAGLTTGVCTLLSGITLIWAAWPALTCPLGGDLGRAICSRMSGTGGLIVMLGLAFTIAGVAIVWRIARRLIHPDGASGWTWGEGLAIIVAGITTALLIPTFHCPAGYELTPVFHWCRSSTQLPELISHPPTWMWWKVGIAVGAVVGGVIVARWRRLPWPVASILTVAVVAPATWYLAQRTVGLPTIG
jgi:hypothetical protein